LFANTFICPLNNFHIPVQSEPFWTRISKSTPQSGANWLFVSFGEISYLVIHKENKNDQEPSLLLIRNYIEKVVIDKNVSVK